MVYKIGFRTLKTAIAVSFAITLAQFCQLDFYVSSAIMTILCVQNSKKKSLKSAAARLTACLLSLPFSFLFFEGIGYYPSVIGLLLLFFIPVTVVVKSNEGIVTSTVIILHIYSTGSLTLDVVLNEIGLIIIGIGSALLFNMHMPKLDRKLIVQKEYIEAYIKHTLAEIAVYLRTNETYWMKQQMASTFCLIKEIKRLAALEKENHLSGQYPPYYQYFEICEKQLYILERVTSRLHAIPLINEQRKMLADCMESISLAQHPRTIHQAKSQLKECKLMAMSPTKEMLETVIEIFIVFKELEDYLHLKESLNREAALVGRPKEMAFYQGDF